MKLGFLTPFSEDALKIAKQGPFQCLEIGGANGWVDQPDQRKQALALLDKYGIFAASFMVLGPSIRTPKDQIPAETERMGRLMDMANEFGGAVLTGAAPMGYDPSKNLGANVALFKEVYSPIADVAEKKGVKIAFENWPGGRGPFGDNGNLTVTPESIAMMLDAVPSDNIGLEFDPSHFLWQSIDPMAAARQFVKRIHILHLKDTEVNETALAWKGRWGHGWWRYRLPGFAKFDWHGFFALLHELGWDGNGVIEHEDGSFDGERRPLGFLLSGDYLKKAMMD